MDTWCIFGFADDEGVANTGGRTGAAAGPQSFMTAWRKLNGKRDLNARLEIIPFAEAENKTLQEKHDEAISLIRDHQQQFSFSVAVGGGHDYAYCHLKGLAEAFPGAVIGCVNIDPHLDMRNPYPVVNSGSPFRLAIENKVISGSNLVEYGIQPHANAEALWKFAEQHEAIVVDFENAIKNDCALFEKHLNDLCRQCDVVLISLDMDCLGAPFAPGVSAPAPEGFFPTQVRQMLQNAATRPQVKSLGIYELNPNYDIDLRTAKLAATMAWYFADGKLM